MGGLALGLADREARHRHCLAAEGIPELLGLESAAREAWMAGVSAGIRALIRRMGRENPGWGAPRIHGELLKLGIDIGETSVSKYLVRSRKPLSENARHLAIVSR